MLLFPILCLLPVLSASTDPVLETDIGRFVGKLLTFDSGLQVDAFYGVPFAKPPVGPLRFEKPQNAEYVEEREAKTLPKICIQMDGPFEQSEDCLYLNVYRPHNKTDTYGYPGFFFIHGGGYQMGYSHQHTTDYVAENYAAQGMTVVIPQYRVSIYGFAATENRAIPGNNGLHDLHKALLFTRRNAKGLYLDNGRITVGGYSAGAAAASALSISPLTHDLFSQVVQFSGSTFAEWAFSKRGTEHTERVVKILGCDAEREVRKCLQGKSLKDINEAVEKAHEFEGQLNFLDYAPTVDGDFIPVDPATLIELAKPKPTLASLTQNEGLLFSIYFPSDGRFWRHGLEQEKKDAFSVEDFKEHVRTAVVLKKIFGDQHEEVAEEIANFYLATVDPQQHDKNFFLDMYAKVFGDIMFAIPQLRELRMKLKAGWTIYHILSTHTAYTKRNFGHVECHHTTHGIEYEFLFGQGVFGNTTIMTEEDEEYRKLLVGSVVEFVKTGSPKSELNPNFVALSPSRPLIYTDLSSEAVIKEPLFGRELEFWDKMSDKLHFDIVFGVHKDQKKRNEL
ncbi:unnamed protein product [Bursaphelenchus xylophilus]|uniref:(pine wood nematode) hypothetical protein n=1 Tax=Bursaphelenchus xylophilus TaxID=6326 RepID=A0A1I7RMA7_BURXY|nr:unnamed protein product [Bursaphelenchus xylophilus]CAG9118338.1 unnamed protein product [Bursaphelenchus xylophilus]